MVVAPAVAATAVVRNFRRDAALLGFFVRSLLMGISSGNRSWYSFLQLRRFPDGKRSRRSPIFRPFRLATFRAEALASYA
jgi:hypothetical protein